MSEANNNPFAALLNTEITAGTSSNLEGKINDNEIIGKDDEIAIINVIVQNVFHFTINAGNSDDLAKTNTQLVYLEDLANAMDPTILIDLDTLEQALFERLLLTTPELYVIPRKDKAFLDHVVQNQVFPYLYESIKNLHYYKDNLDPVVQKVVTKIKELIFRNAVTALKQPALFELQEFPEQLVELLKRFEPYSHSFFLDIVTAFVSEGGEEVHEQLRDAMLPVLRRLFKEINKCNIINLPMYILPSVQLFASNPHLAPIFLLHCEPQGMTQGRYFEDNCLGALLNLSVLPKNVAAPFDYFENPTKQEENSVMETSIWNASYHLTSNLHKTIFTLLKAGPEMREKMLTWIGRCLKANNARGKLWSMQAGELSAAGIACVSDGFMLNLGAVLLQLCQPFCTAPDDPKSLKIDPTYAAVPPEQCASKGVHLDCLSSATCLLPARENDEGRPIDRPTAETYGFVTECFFMTQKCIDLGVRVIAEKLWQTGQDLGRLQHSLEEIANESEHLKQPLKHKVQRLMTKYISLRCSLTEKNMLSNLNRFQAMTCTWLVQNAVRPNPESPQKQYAPTTMLPVKIPVPTPAPDLLRCIPELIMENIIVLITVARRASGPRIEAVNDSELLQPALTLILTFMGDSTRIYNPHLRARLAECLEAMLPNQSNEQHPLTSLASFYREQLFKEHPHRLHLVPCLLDVFVGIEMTGQSVQFEQKFNYRRPMYLVIDFLWTYEEHRNVFTQLAREAEANMEAVHPPIFLRFVNLLMNDAIFLLDEALSNMAQIRNLQTQLEDMDWTAQPTQEREQSLLNLNHVGMLARFDNILGRDTVRTLVQMTAHAGYVFCHPTLVERIASTLNYFLTHLVGPNKKNFKVKDMKEFEFEPRTTVLDICRMYVQLGYSDRFLAAVSDDGRSYTPQLFTQAIDVLTRIDGGGLLIYGLSEFAERVKTMAKKREKDEEILANAPDDFLDPIMSTVMMDPVILPSSKITIDRTTIARHLLSDQTDPFNRSPLSMDQVKSDTELKERIQTWIAQETAKHTAQQHAD